MKSNFCIALVLIFCFFMVGWTSVTHQKVVVDATKLTPYALKLLIHHYKKEVLAGSIAPLRGVKGEDHYLLVDGSYGKAHKLIDSKVKQTIMKLKRRKISLSEFCYELGVLSYYMSEVNNPLLTGDLKREGSWIYSHFVHYTESRLATFSLSFEVYRNDLLEKKDYQGYVIFSAIRSAKLYPSLRDKYVGRRLQGLGYQFDDRSVPYAISSLSYNYSVIDTARLWFYIWKELNGDTSFTPYLDKDDRGHTGN